MSILNQLNSLSTRLEKNKIELKSFVSNTFPDFIGGWVYDELITTLQQFMLDVRAKKSPRIIISFPPRHGKSELTSVRFALYCLLNNVDWEIVCATYAQNLSDKFSRKARELLDNNYIKTTYPNINLCKKQSSVHEWKITVNNISAGTYKACGIGGALTGSGANVLLIDDYHKNYIEADSKLLRDRTEDWYTSVARTRLAPGAGIIIIAARWHIDDLIGRILKNTSAEKFTLFEYRAIAESDEKFRNAGEALHPARYDIDALNAIKNAIPARFWAALFQQRPIVLGGNMFKAFWFKFYEEKPDSFDQIIQSWDVRFGKSQKDTSSFVVGQVWGRIGNQYYLIDQVRGRWGYTETKQNLRHMSAKYPEAYIKIIEKKANGEALEDDLQNEIPGIILYEPRGDKIQRAERITPICEAENINIPNPNKFHFCSEWIDEITNFPLSSNDDQVDAFSMAIQYFLENSGDLEIQFF